ncbi:MAG: hypothetical protein ACI8PZ_000387 [Myxococcota bacterium]|jgi:hypothetical protein
MVRCLPLLFALGCATSGLGELRYGEDCANEVDDDGDGHVDCADQDCASECADGPTVPGTATGGGGTGGGTGGGSGTAGGTGTGSTPADTGDTGSTLPAVEDCANGVDDDADGQVDCFDSDCEGDGACPEACANGVDDDADALVDCDDPDCDGGCDERCNDDRDNDGDGLFDLGDPDCDADGDGWPPPEKGGLDCDDTEARIHPGADDVCEDGIDQDCDGEDAPCSAPNPECSAYSTLTESWRHVSQIGAVYCDRDVLALEGWFRYDGAAGTQMPESSPGENYCSTHAPGWLDGVHPAVVGDTRSVRTCFHWSGDTCLWETMVDVTHCGAFFVYYLPTLPFGCNGVYCGE